MDKNSLIGFALIFILFMVWGQLNTPSAEELAAKRTQDSLEQVQNNLDSEEIAAAIEEETQIAQPEVSDSAKMIQMAGKYGVFGNSAVGSESTQTLENDLVKIEFSNKGGRITSVKLKEYKKNLFNDQQEEVITDLYLQEDKKNKFEYQLPIAGAAGGIVNTSNLYFTPTLKGNTLSFKANAGNGKYFEQKYVLESDGYGIDYDINFVGLENDLRGDAKVVKLRWDSYLDKLERSEYYDRIYSSIYYKETDDNPTYCTCTSDDEVDTEDKSVKWLSHSNQFFNASLIAKETNFKSAFMETKMYDETNEDLKFLGSEISIPLNDKSFAMHMYIGPNEFDRLNAYEMELEDIIPYGRSILGTLNRWVIRPMFNLLSGIISNKGIVILVLTFIIKLVLYPLTYKMLYSQSKMGALKPRIEKMKEKNPDDAQAAQMETMKLYQEYGVSPLGGCLPIFLQMPIWIALYRFFPASIEFRQASFLWATDLSSFDVAFNLPFELPMQMGAHISAFTLLYAITSLIYTYYNTKHMDMSANPSMKYMQYLMPIFFMGFFNSYASGLTCYLFFSNLFNITQTIVTKNYLIDQDKIAADLEAYKKKPKKKKKGGGFQERLSKALKEQQELQKQRDLDKSKSIKKKKK